MNRSGVLTQHYLVVTGLVPHQTAALSVLVLCAPYNHAPVYTLVFHNSSSYLSVKSDRAWSLQAVLLHALEVVQDAPQLGHLGQPAQMQSGQQAVSGGENINGSGLLGQTADNLVHKGFDRLAPKGFDSLTHKGFDSLTHNGV